jgi:NADH-quinone oxidoreductase subunit J
MTVTDWITTPVNWVFAIVALAVLASAFRVVTAKNVVHAALFLVATLAGSAGLFLILSAEFVAWVLVLVYIGAVIVLFLFGIMITRAPTGYDESLDGDRKIWPAILSVTTFALMTWASLEAFGTRAVSNPGEGTDTEVIGIALMGRFVVPFEVVSFVLLAALIGGITIARRDLTPAEEEERTLV